MFKNDITSIPFEKIKSAITKRSVDMQKALLDNLKLTLAASNTRKLTQTVETLKQHIHSEEGEDGLEESAREALNLDDPEEIALTEGQVNDIQKQAREITLASFIEHFKIGEKHTWLLPQMIAAFGSWKAIKNEEGKYCGKLTAAHNTVDDFNYGLWVLAMRPRSELITATKGVQAYTLTAYNQLVPLILNGFKKYQNIKYSEWTRDSARFLVDEGLGKAMLATLPNISSNEILELRAHCQTAKTGRNAGKQMSPMTTATFWHLDSCNIPEARELPKLALHMLCQTWCAHPSNRNTLTQVLDPNNWDNAPDPLVTYAIIKEQSSEWGGLSKQVKEAVDSAW